MIRPSKLAAQLQAIFICGLLTLTGCENGNLFGKLTDSKDSSDPATLILQAENLLREGNFAASLALYEKALAKSPSNAKALYGAAAAAVGSSGLNIGLLIANLINQNSSANSFGDLVRKSRVGAAAPGDDPNSILAGVDREALNNVIDTAICRLNRIVAGAADGTIPAGSIDVLLNLGSLCIIRAILKPLRADIFDIVNNGGDFEIDYGGNNSGTLTMLCDDNPALIRQVARDIAGAYALFNRAVTLLGLSSNTIISDIRDDIATALDLLLNAASPSRLPVACRNLIENAPPGGAGIDLGNFQTNDDVFTMSSFSC